MYGFVIGVVTEAGYVAFIIEFTVSIEHRFPSVGWPHGYFGYNSVFLRYTQVPLA